MNAGVGGSPLKGVSREKTPLHQQIVEVIPVDVADQRVTL